MTPSSSTTAMGGSNRPTLIGIVAFTLAAVWLVTQSGHTDCTPARQGQSKAAPERKETTTASTVNTREHHHDSDRSAVTNAHAMNANGARSFVGIESLPQEELDRRCPRAQQLSFIPNFEEFTLAAVDAANVVAKKNPQNVPPRTQVVKHFGNRVAPKADVDTTSLFPMPIPAKGLALEFGVASGKSMTMWAQSTMRSAVKRFAGFDTFTGLPEDWRPGFAKGAFGKANKYLGRLQAQLSPLGVDLVKGMFQDTLPQYLAKYNASTPISFAHIDGDMFISAVIPLALMTPRFRVGTVILWDELLAYPHFEKHEVLAMHLWLAQTRATLCVAAKAHEEPREATFVKGRKEGASIAEAVLTQIIHLPAQPYFGQ